MNAKICSFQLIVNKRGIAPFVYVCELILMVIDLLSAQTVAQTAKNTATIKYFILNGSENEGFV